ncbi:SDR family NAD(P)-dependent oxidoreductase [Peribacillus cavernae]|uniref:SDR family NAD(P)-dependent oxidoreductase n=1 Tax=Peribacillus cavernae TaxID=1674310 RepID=A0A433HFR7_9BACI|nr:SDR family NAD(P)-dependent oxidoreductase [Peribacillus cavernae]
MVHYILINNAGTSSAHPFENVKENMWKEDLGLKLFGAVNCSRESFKYMKDKPE